MRLASPPIFWLEYLSGPPPRSRECNLGDAPRALGQGPPYTPVHMSKARPFVGRFALGAVSGACRRGAGT